ncbi:MAG TPA: hypothetical protein VEQ10_07310, partial [Vicinamibacteria bacterium]|nr:hypothetical protein [Vicinamibacteria bacterium]
GMTTPTSTTTTTTTRPSSFGSSGNVLGPFQGVASTSTEKSLRIFNGRQKYSEWLFLPGQQRVIGRPPGGGLQPGSPFGPARPGLPAGLPTPGGVPPGGGAGIPPNLAPPPPPAY